MIWLLACAVDSGPSRPVLDDFGPIPAFSVTDQTGAVRTQADVAGKVLLVDFMFTSCPDICPTLTAHMAEVGRKYAQAADLRLVSFTVDPVTDTPPVLAVYAAKYGALPDRWSFYTGELEAVRAAVVGGFKQVMEASGGTTDPDTILHGSRFIVVDRKGRMRAFVNPMEPGMAELYAAVDAALAER